MNDKELLELAAKSIGGVLEAEECGEVATYWIALPDKFRLWNPLADDGDAFRLAVNLNLSIRFDSEPDGAVVFVAPEYDCLSTADQIEPLGDAGDRSCAATRKAIVRCAAAIGKEAK